jgi:hypothetical protein
MRNKSVALAILLLALQGSASAGDISVEEQLNSLLGNAANTIANPNATPLQKKEAAETIKFGSAAKDINAVQTSMEEKNRLCQSKGKALADTLGYNLGFFLGKCNEVFK